MDDRFGTFSDSVSSPANSAVAVTPHDSNALPFLPKALYVGTGGDITLRAKYDDADVVFVGVPSGAMLSVRATHVRATGTSASDIVAMG